MDGPCYCPRYKSAPADVRCINRGLGENLVQADPRRRRASYQTILADQPLTPCAVAPVGTVTGDAPCLRSRRPSEGPLQLSDDTELRVKADSERPGLGGWADHQAASGFPVLCADGRTLCSIPVPAGRVIPVSAYIPSDRSDRSDRCNRVRGVSVPRGTGVPLRSLGFPSLPV